METAFKIVFSIAVFLFCLVVIGIFLLLIKLLIMFTGGEVQIFGLVINSASQ